MNIYTCQICGSHHKNFRKLSKHIRDNHTISIKDYYDTYLKKEKEGFCELCESPTKYLYISKGYRKTCGSKCAAIYRRKELKGDAEKFASFTKKVSANQTEIWVDRGDKVKKEIFNKISSTNIEKNRLLSDQERRELYSRYYRCDEETIDRLNNIGREQCMKNDVGYKNCKKGRFVPKNLEKYIGDVNNIIYRSGLELRVFNFLDQKTSIVNWASEEVVIPYISPVDGKYHRYFPDILAKIKQPDGQIVTILIEIKPYSQTKEPQGQKRKTKRYITEVVTYGINTSKWKAAEEYCADRGWKFQILTEKEILG